MTKIINHIIHTDKRRLLIYLLSYAIYRLINNTFSYSVLTLLNEESFRDRWTSLSVPCGDTPHLFLILFQVFKVLLFIVFIRLIKQKANGLLSEIFIAYFIYDLVFILSFMWMYIPFPDNHSHFWMFISSGPMWSLISSGQIHLSCYLPHLDLIFACLWTTALFIVLKHRNRLSFMFLINRLMIIPVSVFIMFWLIYLVGGVV